MLRKDATISEVSAMRSLNRGIDSTWVDWAVQMLVDGQDTSSLRILAGEFGPFNHFEMASLVDRVLNELGVLQNPSKADALLVLATSLIRRLALGARDYSTILYELKGLYNEGDMDPRIGEFQMLYWAYEDLQDSDFQYYWDGATRGNIASIVVQEAMRWIEELESGVLRTSASETPVEDGGSLDLPQDDCRPHRKADVANSSGSDIAAMNRNGKQHAHAASLFRLLPPVHAVTLVTFAALRGRQLSCQDPYNNPYTDWSMGFLLLTCLLWLAGGICALLWVRRGWRVPRVVSAWLLLVTLLSTVFFFQMMAFAIG